MLVPQRLPSFFPVVAFPSGPASRLSASQILAQGRRWPAVQVRECCAHSPGACKPRAFSDQSDRKIGVIEEAFGALDTQRLGDLQRRRMKVFGKEPR
jgi:hypothetical protein